MKLVYNNVTGESVRRVGDDSDHKGKVLLSELVSLWELESETDIASLICCGIKL